MQPPYSPNTVNQTVDYGGFTWKGNPGQGWSKQTTSGGAPVSTGDSVADATNLASWAQKQQIQANQPAIQTLQGQQGTLSKAYSDLLTSVMGQGTVAQNYAQTGENNLLGQRGITNNSPYYDQQMTQALLPVQTQNQQSIANLGMGSAQDLGALAAQIASLQAGNFGQGLSFGGNLANIAQQQPLVQAQAAATNFIPIPNYGVWDINKKQLIGGLSGVPGQGVVNVNGVPSLNIP